MKKSSDFYKVVNAVINTLNGGNCVSYVTGGQGGSGYGVFDTNEDNDKVRDTLLQYADCEELDEDELLDDWKEDDRNSGFDFWQLYNYGDNGSFIQLAINPDEYVNSYQLRDMIIDDLDMKAAEITEGMNGYPRNLRGCVLINDNKHTFDELEQIAERYGVEIVELKQKAGWQLWECRGTAFGLFDQVDYQANHNDNFKWVESWKAYADDIREFVEANIRYNEIDKETANKLNELAELAEQREPLGDNEFICWEYNDYDRYEVMNRMVDHFGYDSSYYTLSFDCAIRE